MAALGHFGGLKVKEGQHLELSPDLVLWVGVDFNFTWSYSGLQCRAVETLLGWPPDCLSLAVQPWARHLTFLILNFCD